MIMAKPPPRPIPKAASGCKLVGGLFILLGGLPVLSAMLDGRGWIAQIAGAAPSLLLVGPGVWYVIAGIFLQRKQCWAIITTYKVALTQMIVVVIVIVAMNVVPSRNRNTMAVFVPAILMIFFVP